MPYKAYSPANVSCIAGGPTVRGYAPETMIRVKYTQEQAGMEIGCDGDGMHYDILDASGTIEIDLHLSSPTNDIFQTYATSKAIFRFLVKDSTTLAGLCATNSAKIQKVPDWERGKAPGFLTWIIQFTSGKINHSGAKEASVI